jgi:hypothetical protein
MQRSAPFRGWLLKRLLFVTGLAVPVGCTTEVVVEGGDGDGGNGGAGASGPAGPVTSGPGPGGGVSTASGSMTYTDCFDWSEGHGGAGGEDLPCPVGEDAIPYLGQTACGVFIQQGPWEENGQCCYVVTQEDCLAGRPFVAAGAARRAAARRGAFAEATVAPSLEGVSAAARARLAEAWTRDGLYEHASVASFGRFALELLAVGAPADLVADAHASALDEVRHARACLALASAYAGEPVAPGPFPFEGRVEVSSSLADVAARAAHEGCVGETLAAIVAAEQLAAATDPAVRAALAQIAPDEARHAELAWRTVAWALEQGGAEVHAAVQSAFASAIAELSRDADVTPVEDDRSLRAHGRVDPATERRVRRVALLEVVRPCAERLLARHAASQGATLHATIRT